MRKLALVYAYACACAFVLVGCQTTSGGGLTPAAIQAAVLAACAYTAPAEEIAQLLSHASGIGTAEQIAAIVCQAVAGTTTPKTVRLRGVTLHLRHR